VTVTVCVCVYIMYMYVCMYVSSEEPSRYMYYDICVYIHAYILWDSALTPLRVGEALG
jgi:hypothetical protein